jgi:hypothetical protein
VWAKLIEALADLGYDANNIVRPPPHPAPLSLCCRAASRHGGAAARASSAQLGRAVRAAAPEHAPSRSSKIRPAHLRGLGGLRCARTRPPPPPRAQIGETYDWRLAIPNMERRDAYFTRLKIRIEVAHQVAGEKVRADRLRARGLACGGSRRARMARGCRQGSGRLQALGGGGSGRVGRAGER